MVDDLKSRLDEFNDQLISPQVPKPALPEEISKTPMPEVGGTKNVSSGPLRAPEGDIGKRIEEFNKGLVSQTQERPIGIPERKGWSESPIAMGLGGHFVQGFQTLPKLVQKTADIAGKAIGLEKAPGESIAEKATRVLEPKPEQKAGMEELGKTLPGMIAGGIAEAPGSIAPYMIGGGITHALKIPGLVASILTMAGIGAVSRSDKGAEAVIKGLPEDVIIGGIFHYLGPAFKKILPGGKTAAGEVLAEGGMEVTRAGQTRIVKASVMAAMFGGQALKDTGDIREAISSGFVGALLGSTSGGKKEKGIYPKRLLPVSKQNDAEEKFIRGEPSPGYDESDAGFIPNTDMHDVTERVIRWGPDTADLEMPEHIDVGAVLQDYFNHSEKELSDGHQFVKEMKINPANGEIEFKFQNDNTINTKQIKNVGLVATAAEDANGKKLDLNPQDMNGDQFKNLFGLPDLTTYSEKSVEKIKVIPEKIENIDTRVPLRQDIMKPKPPGESPLGPSSPRLPLPGGEGHKIFEPANLEELSKRFETGGSLDLNDMAYKGNKGEHKTFVAGIWDTPDPMPDHSPSKLGEYFEKNLKRYQKKDGTYYFAGPWKNTIEPSESYDQLREGMKAGVKRGEKAVFYSEMGDDVNLRDPKDGSKIFGLDKDGNLTMEKLPEGVDRFIGVSNDEPSIDWPAQFLFNESITGSTMMVSDLKPETILKRVNEIRDDFLKPGVDVIYKGKPGYKINERATGEKDKWTIYNPAEPGKLIEATADDLKTPESIDSVKKLRAVKAKERVVDKEPEEIPLRSATKRFSPKGFGESVYSGTEKEFYTNNKDFFDKPNGPVRRWYAWTDEQPTEKFFAGKELTTIKERLKIFDERKASPEELKDFADKKNELNEKWVKDFGFNRTMPEQAIELDYAAAKWLGYDGLNQGEHVGIFKDLSEIRKASIAGEKARAGEAMSPKLAARTMQIFNDIGGEGLTGVIRETIEKNPEMIDTLKRDHGMTDEEAAGAFIAGQFTRGNVLSLAEVAMGKEAPVSAIHETIHFLEAVKLMKSEKDALGKWMPDEEKRVEKLANIIHNDLYGGVKSMLPESIRKIVVKLENFIKDFGKFLKGEGYGPKDVDKIIRDIETGEIGKRRVRETPLPEGARGPVPLELDTARDHIIRARAIKDAEKEIQDNIKAASTGIKGIKDGMARLFAPGSRGEGAARTVVLAGKVVAERERANDVFAKSMEQARGAFNKMSVEDQRAFCQAASTDGSGKNQATPELRELRKSLTDISEQTAKEVNHWLPDDDPMPIREAYWPNPSELGVAEKDLPTNRNIEPTGFMKSRTFQEFNDKIDKGYVPFSENPIDQFERQMAMEHKFIDTHNLLDQLERTGDAAKIESGEKVPAGWESIPPPYGVTKTGRYVMTDQAAQIFKNWMSRPLSSNKYFGDAYRAYMDASTVLQRAQLFGFFHGGFVTAESTISRGSLAMKQGYRLLQNPEEVPLFLKTAATVPLAPFQKFKMGREILKEWSSPGTSTDPKVLQAVEDVMRGGGGFSQEKMFTNLWTEGMKKDFREGRRISAALKSPMAVMEIIMKPLMQTYVPALKAGAFEELSSELRRVKPNLSDAEYNSEMRQIWNRIDSRLGQVRWQRIFMNNATKNFVQMVIRAPGWTGGTIMEIGGAPVDVVRYVQEWKKTGKMPTTLPDRVAYVASLAVTTMMTNAALTCLFAKKTPDQLTTEDYMAFQTGDIDERGKPLRGMLPLYSKDVYAYIKAPASTLWHKTNPIIGLIYELGKNKDYYGTGIIDPTKGQGEKIGEIGKFLAKAFIPFGERGREKISEERGTTVKGTLMPAVGIMPAPSYFSQSKATQKALEFGALKMPEGGRTQEEYERNRLLNSHVKRYLSAAAKGEPVEDVLTKLGDDVRSGKLKQQDVMRFKTKIKGQSLESSVTRLSIDQAMAVWKVATDEEKRKIVPLIFRKFRNLKDPRDKQEYAPEMEKISGDLSRIYGIIKE